MNEGEINNTSQVRLTSDYSNDSIVMIETAAQVEAKFRISKKRPNTI